MSELDDQIDRALQELAPSEKPTSVMPKKKSTTSSTSSSAPPARSLSTNPPKTTMEDLEETEEPTNRAEEFKKALITRANQKSQGNEMRIKELSNILLNFSANLKIGLLLCSHSVSFSKDTTYLKTNSYVESKATKQLEKKKTLMLRLLDKFPKLEGASWGNVHIILEPECKIAFGMLLESKKYSEWHYCTAVYSCLSIDRAATYIRSNHSVLNDLYGELIKTYWNWDATKTYAEQNGDERRKKIAKAMNEAYSGKKMDVEKYSKYRIVSVRHILHVKAFKIGTPEEKERAFKELFLKAYVFPFVLAGITPTKVTEFNKREMKDKKYMQDYFEVEKFCRFIMRIFVRIVSGQFDNRNGTNVVIKKVSEFDKTGESTEKEVEVTV